MDNASHSAVAKILKNAGVKSIRSTGGKVTISAVRELNQEDIAHGEEFIQHFGVKGMRWGVRRSDKQLARAAKEREYESSNDVSSRKSKTRTKAESKVKLSDLSDAELRQKLNRIQMEKQYKELTAPKANPITAAGKKVASGAVKAVAQQTLTSLGQSYATKYTADYMAGGKKAFDKK